MNKIRHLLWGLFLCPFGKHWWITIGAIPPYSPKRKCLVCRRKEVWVDGQWVLEVNDA